MPYCTGLTGTAFHRQVRVTLAVDGEWPAVLLLQLLHFSDLAHSRLEGANFVLELPYLPCEPACRTALQSIEHNFV